MGWTFGRVTFMGDAAHPMYPRGSQWRGAGAHRCANAGGPPGELTATPRERSHEYEKARLEATTRIVRTNREHPPDFILMKVEELTGGKRFRAHRRRDRPGRSCARCPRATRRSRGSACVAGRLSAGPTEKAMARIEKKLREALPGISGILVTPFDKDDRIAPARLEADHRPRDRGRCAHPDRERQYRRVLRAHHRRGRADGPCGRGADGRAGAVPRRRRPQHRRRVALARPRGRPGRAALMVHQPPDPFVVATRRRRLCERIAKRVTAFRSCSICATTGSASTRSSSFAACRASPA